MRIVLKADEGYIYTNGTDVYGSTIYLAEGVSADGFYQITREEYEEKIKAEEEVEMI